MSEIWECVVVGGGAAGLSAALVLGRARRRTLVVDAGRQSNLAAHGIGGLLGFDTVPPAELYARGRRELARYPSVRVHDGEVTSAAPSEDGFTVGLAGGETLRTRRILLAMGMRYEYPQLPGMAELWGNSVFHCPFCHGWEVRDRPLAVLAAGERGVHMATLLRRWSDDVVLLASGLTEDQRMRLAGAAVGIDERPVAELRSTERELSAVVFEDGTDLPRGGLLVETTLHQRSSLATELGAEFAPPNPVTAESIAVDAMYRTTVPGVFAAGDVSAQMPQVAAAIAAGSGAAASVVASISEEEK
ncbi:NAD(P)/FAD-dependent oxidoreductase [Mycobacterium sp. EPG1]|nr:NAD(P)/FAD-dependent oxidoreductase [Mycobacterium sp. EPG1]